VDIDPRLFDIGRRYFGLTPRPGLREFAQDARPFLRETKQRYDTIFVDAYRQPYIPFYLTTREFFTLVHQRLRPGGSVIVNVGHPDDSDALEQTLSTTLGAVFANIARDPIEPTNSLVIASDAPLRVSKLLEAPGPLLSLAREQRLEPRLRGGSVFTDDRAPVEWLVDASIVKYAASGASG
jgi:hypothetical protein